MTDDAAVHLVYLVAGIEHKLALHRTTNRLLDEDFQHPLLGAGGHIGMVVDLAPKAKLIADYIVEHDSLHSDDYPGVFEYEVTELLGQWYADNPKATDEEFAAQLDATAVAFFSQ